MIYYVGEIPYNSNYLEHHGILGMKWGIRRYQNKDGTLTEAGKQRYQKLRDDIDAERKYSDSVGKTVKSKTRVAKAERKLLKYEQALERDKKVQMDKRAAKEKASKSIKDMSDAELDSAIKDLETKVLRMTKEKRYRQLMSEVSGKKNTSDKKTFNLGQSLVGQILSSSARNIGTQFTTYAMGTALNKIAQNLTEDKELTIVNPKKGQKDK